MSFRNRSFVSVAIMAFTGLMACSAHAQTDTPIDAAEAAESRLGARVGIFVHDTQTGHVWRHRANERFPMASTTKTLVCATLLDMGQKAMDATVPIRESDILEYAPVTKKFVGQAVPASELCAVTMQTSDNTAVNGVFKTIGGPQAVTEFLRKLGDDTTRLDRIEPHLNEGQPGDPRDTSTPEAMAQTLTKLVLGSALEQPAQRQLVTWLTSNKVGGPLLRAGVPSDWKVADRTGAGGFGTRGVTAVMWPPGRAPIVAAVYLTETDAPMEARNAAIANIGRAIASAVTR